MKGKFKVGMFLFFLCAVLGFSVPNTAQAASYKHIYTSKTWDKADRTAAGYTFLTESGKLTAAKSGKTYTIAAASRVGYEVVTDGKVVYFYISSGSYPYTYSVYRTNINGTGKKKLFSYKGGSLGLSGFYGNKLYYITEIDPGTLRTYHVKTKKKSKIAANVTEADQQGQYFYLLPYGGALSGNRPLRVYNAKTGKITRISKCVANYSVVSGKLYYSEYVKCDYSYGKHVLRIKRCNLNGSGQKLLMKSLKARYIIKFGKTSAKYCTYTGKTKTVKY